MQIQCVVILVGDDYQYITFKKRANRALIIPGCDNLSFNTKGYSMDNMALHA